MTVKDLIEKLQTFNPNAKVHVIVSNSMFEFSVLYGGADGCTPQTCFDVDIYVDRLNQSEVAQAEKVEKW